MLIHGKNRNSKISRIILHQFLARSKQYWRKSRFEHEIICKNIFRFGCSGPSEDGFGPYFGYRKLNIVYSNRSAYAETHLPPINENTSSTSLPGGNLVDGLPPAASCTHLRYTCKVSWGYEPIWIWKYIKSWRDFLHRAVLAFCYLAVLGFLWSLCGEIGATES